MSEELKTVPTKNLDDSTAIQVTGLVKALRVDYPKEFHFAYPTDEEVRLFKRRLYTKIKHCDMADIVAGYEYACSLSPQNMPNIFKILSGIEEAKKERKIKENLSQPRIARNIADAKIAAENIKKMREAVKGLLVKY